MARRVVTQTSEPQSSTSGINSVSCFSLQAGLSWGHHNRQLSNLQKNSREYHAPVENILTGPRAGTVTSKGVDCWLHCRKEGHTVDIRITYEEDDTERFTAEALKASKPPDAIVIAGGDGSINQVLMPCQKQTCMMAVAKACLRQQGSGATAFKVVP